jgi:hypothetical protein
VTSMTRAPFGAVERPGASVSERAKGKNVPQH